MAVAVCGVSPLAFPIEQQEQQHQHPEQHEEQQQRFDIWNAIQAQKPPNTTHPLPPYIHPLVRRSSSSLSQKSLEVCTESLGSETGSDVFSDDEFPRTFSSFSEEEDEVKEEEEEEEEDTDDEEEDIEEEEEKELLSVNYHCCIRTRSPARSFPPPLPSISRRDGPCLSMRPHRRDGRLVVEAVHVPSQNYLQAERHNGRLLLSFINTTSPPQPKPQSIPPKQADIEEMPLEEEEVEEEEEDTEEEEEEVEVVDRGTVVEVKVSMQPQQQSGVMKVHRSTLVINKFVGGTPLTVEDEQEEPRPQLRRVPSTTMTAAAAAVVAASSLSGETSSMDSATADSKLLFTSKGRSKGEVLHRMRRCSELRRPIFFWEPCCIATSSS